MKVLVAGGGTAGHITPALAVITSLANSNADVEVLFVCSGKDYETSLLSLSDIDFTSISTGKMRRYGRGKFRELTDLKTQALNGRDLTRVVRGYSQARKVIKRFQPDVVFIKGGYVGVPVGLAAAHLHKPIVVHESDIVMGKANSLLARYAQKVAVSFPIDAFDGAKYKSKFVLTGNPVRQSFMEAALKPAKKPVIKQKPNIFLFAGSQGAEALNTIIFENIELITKHYNLLHVTGEQGIERARFVRHRLPVELRARYEVHSFLKSQMLPAYEWANITITRAGMNTIAELAALSKVAIIVPLPTSTNNHQLKNAQYLARAGAVRVMEQGSLTGLGLMSELAKLNNDVAAQRYLQEAIHKFYVPGAADNIAQLISSLVKKEEG